MDVHDVRTSSPRLTRLRSAPGSGTRSARRHRSSSEWATVGNLFDEIEYPTRTISVITTVATYARLEFLPVSEDPRLGSWCRSFEMRHSGTIGAQGADAQPGPTG